MSFAVSRKEKRIIKKTAKAMGYPLSDFIRRQVLITEVREKKNEVS